MLLCVILNTAGETWPLLEPQHARFSTRFWAAFWSQGLSDRDCLFRVGRFDFIQKAVGCNTQMLSDAGERCEAARISPSLDAADCLPMYSYQFGQTLLCNAGGAARRLDVPTNANEQFLFLHRA